MIRALLLAACLFPAVAHAQRVSRLTGAKLLAICGNRAQGELCEAYISGVADGLVAVQKHMSDAEGRAFPASTCIPDGTTTAALRETVTTYLHTHADLLGRPAIFATYDALHANYACSGHP